MRGSRQLMRVLGMRLWDATPLTRRIKLWGYAKLLGLKHKVSIHSHVMIYPHHILPLPAICNNSEATGVVIGEGCKFEDNVNLDTSGGVIIGNNVRFNVDVLIYTHNHNKHQNPSLPVSEITTHVLRIDDGAVIGARSIILASCHHIGKNVRIGAGAVVTKDIPDNAVAVGVPARVIKYLA